jgi:hypothetical protein
MGMRTQTKFDYIFYVCDFYDRIRNKYLIFTITFSFFIQKIPSRFVLWMNDTSLAYGEDCLQFFIFSGNTFKSVDSKEIFIETYKKIFSCPKHNNKS